MQTPPSCVSPGLPVNNLGVFYTTAQAAEGGEAAYTEGPAIGRELAKENPATYLPDVAETLNN